MVVDKVKQPNKTSELLARDACYLAPTPARCFEIVAERASGSYIWDVEGNRYLDFTMGIGVNNIGHCHPAVVQATQEQIEKLIHCSCVTHHKLSIELAEKLTQITPGPLDSVFFNNSGGEAVDAAIKMARYVSGRPNIVAFTGAFHGRTLLATALTTAKSHYREGYEPLPSGIYSVPYPYCYRCPVNQTPGKCDLECFGLLNKLFEQQVKPHTIAAIIMEPVLGEGGYVVPATGYAKQDGYMRRIRELCSEQGILLVFDEVQSGFGRTGKWFGCDNWSVEPDVMIMAKGIASGFPMAAIISRKELMDKWTIGRHGSTYGGNPVACAAALASISVIEKEGLLDRAYQVGATVRDRLKELAESYLSIGEVRGLGLMIGVEIINKMGEPDGVKAARLIEEFFRRGLLLLDCGQKDHIFRLIPPLNVSDAEVNEALGIIEDGFARVA
ncbi:MAG: aminotransferase class III-fold pyridoxal phosphate-dependent enzyme [Candidatus Melainabacteria bacterium]|nr:aminotransferase class III-fold pyridoxal phosphate-dependent enzyme [Candidatus Melainabacteria bacterium]